MKMKPFCFFSSIWEKKKSWATEREKKHRMHFFVVAVIFTLQHLCLGLTRSYKLVVNVWVGLYSVVTLGLWCFIILSWIVWLAAFLSYRCLGCVILNTGQCEDWPFCMWVYTAFHVLSPSVSFCQFALISHAWAGRLWGLAWLNSHLVSSVKPKLKPQNL